MTSRSMISVVVSLVAASLLVACAGMQGPPGGAKTEVLERFRKPVGADQLGIRIVDGQTTSSMSPKEIERVGEMLGKMLRASGRFDAVINHMSEDSDGDLEMVLNVSVTEFVVATEQQRTQGIRSKMVAKVDLLDQQKRNRGSAIVQSVGKHLDVVEHMRTPDTIVFFGEALLQLLE
jgi:hypothetical protein